MKIDLILAKIKIMSRIWLFFFLMVVIAFSSCNYTLKNKSEEEPVRIIVDKDILIDSTENWTLKPGYEVIFKDTFKIIVKGKLSIKGSKTNPVILSSADSLPAWERIVFDKPTDKSSIENAIFRNTRIMGHKVDLKISHTKFYNNLQLDKFDAVVRVYGGSIHISDCFVEGNNTGEGFLIHEIIDKPAIVENCEFRGIADAIEFLWVKRQGKIINNKILDVEQNNGDGIDFNGCDSILIEGNIFANIRDYGCEIGNDKYGPSKNIFIRNNIFTNCSRGIVVKGGSEVFAQGNIFYKNKIAVKCQVETWSKVTDANTLIVENSIFNNSNELDYLNNENSILKITNSCSDKTLDGNSNIIGTPQFTDPVNLDFSFSDSSSCGKVLKRHK